MLEYPRTANWLEFEPLEDGRYMVWDSMMDDTTKIEPEMMSFLRKLDGRTDPSQILTTLSKEDVDDVINNLTESGLVRKSGRRLDFGDRSLVYTLWIPKITERITRIAKICNAVLMLSNIPAFILGLLVYWKLPDINDEEPVWWMMIILTIAGILGAVVVGGALHEISHAMACIAYGGSVYEFGLMFHGPLPGAYTFMSSNRVKGRVQHAQIDAAGVQMNLLLAGASFAMIHLVPIASDFLLSFALVNLQITKRPKNCWFLLVEELHD